MTHLTSARDTRWRAAAVSAALLVITTAFAAGTTPVSVNGSGATASDNSGGSAISASGRHVAFQSAAPDLVAGDTNAMNDVFLRDLKSGGTTRVSVDQAGAEANGQSFSASISANGRVVAFLSGATNLVAGDTNTRNDVFVRDVKRGTTTRASVSTAGAQADRQSTEPHISGNGRFVVFASDSSNLVENDTNGESDVFVRDLKLGTTTRVSVSSAGAEADEPSATARISANGRYVVFLSDATNLVAGDTNGATDIFLHDLKTRTTTRVSVDSSGAEADNDSDYPSISANGRIVAFESGASNLVAGDTNQRTDVFVRDLKSRTTTRASLDSAGAQSDGFCGSARISGNGRFVAFTSGATNLAPGDANASNDVFVRDLKSAATTRESVSATGGEGLSGGNAVDINSNGRYVTFTSSSTNLVEGDVNVRADVFVRDRRP